MHTVNEKSYNQFTSPTGSGLKTYALCMTREPRSADSSSQLAGRERGHQAGESGTRLCMRRGTAFGLFLRGIECQVKPCPGEKKSEQGFCTRHLCVAPQPGKSIKDTKKILQENIFHGSTEKINVTFMELSKQVGSLEL